MGAYHVLCVLLLRPLGLLVALHGAGKFVVQALMMVDFRDE